jgi:ribose transport system substrate-binding protein
MGLMSRRGAALSAAAVMLSTVAFASAGGAQSPAPADGAAAANVPCQLPAGKSGGQFKVALANREITNDANRDIIQGATDEIVAAGGVIAQTTDAGTDPLKHNDNIATLINSDVDAILVQLGDAQQLSPLAQQAKDKGILMATTLVGATADGALTDVGFDDPLAAALETRALFSSIGYKGDVYLFWVPGAPILETRRAIAETMAKDYPQITIHEVPTEHGAVKTLSQMTDILTANPDPGSIAGVWGAYDLLVSGAVEAVRRAGRDEIKAVSIDGDKIAFQMLFEDKSPFVSTVVADMKGIGKVAADAIILAACGRANEVPLRGYTPMWVANRHNGIAAGEKRWGENLWADVSMDKAAIEQAFPQTQDVMVVQPQLP